MDELKFLRFKDLIDNAHMLFMKVEVFLQNYSIKSHKHTTCTNQDIDSLF